MRPRVLIVLTCWVVGIESVLIFGLDLDPQTTQTISLPTAGLFGTLPTELGLLTALTALDLSDNNLVGPIPTQLGSCTRLSSLLLPGNKIDGTAPSTLTALTALETIDLSHNQLSGDLSVFFFFHNLASLTLRNNSFSGTISSADLVRLSLLEHLDLAHNQFSGLLPEINEISSMRHYDVSDCLFFGHILSPGTLEYLDVSNNQGVTGVINPSFVGCTFLNVSFTGVTLVPGASAPTVCAALTECSQTGISSAECSKCSQFSSASGTLSYSSSASVTPSVSQFPTPSTLASTTATVSPSPTPSNIPVPAGNIRDASFTDMDDTPNVIAGQVAFTWVQTPRSFKPTGFRVVVSSKVANTQRPVATLASVEIPDDNGGLFSSVISLAQVAALPEELAQGQVSLEIIPFNDAGDGASVTILANDLSGDLSEAVTSLVSTTVALTAAASVATSVSASVAAAATTASTTVAATTTTTTTLATTTTTTSTAAAGTTTTSSTGGVASNAGNTASGASSQGLPMGLLAFQLQFIAVTSYQSGKYPRGMQLMAKSLAWTTMNLGFPNSQKLPAAVPLTGTKSLPVKGVADLPNYLNYTPEALLGNVVACLCALAALLAFALAFCTIHKRLWGKPKLLRHLAVRIKIIQLGVRGLYVGYFGLAFAAFHQMMRGTQVLYTLLACALLIVVVVGLPAVCLAVYLVQKRRIQPRDSLTAIVNRLHVVVQPMMSDFRPIHSVFTLVVLARSGFSALCLALFESNHILQSYGMLLIYAVYFALLGVRPYATKPVFRIDVTLCCIDCLTLSVPLFFHYFPSLVLESVPLQWGLLALNLSVVVLYMFYAAILIARQVSLKLRQGTTDWTEAHIRDLMACMANDDEESSGDEKPPKAQCRPSNQFEMEPRHREMWKKAMAGVEVEGEHSTVNDEDMLDLTRQDSVAMS